MPSFSLYGYHMAMNKPIMYFGVEKGIFFLLCLVV